MAFVTPEEIRHYIEDRNPEDNEMDEDLSFSNEEIQVAMRRCARAYNSTPPLRVSTVTPDCMPDETEMFFDGTIWKLYAARLARLSRNDFDFDAGDVNVSPEQKRIAHMGRMAAKAEEAFYIQAHDYKGTKNISAGYGSLG